MYQRTEGVQRGTWQGQLWAPAIVPEERTYSRDWASSARRKPPAPPSSSGPHKPSLWSHTEALKEAYMCAHTHIHAGSQMRSETAYTQSALCCCVSAEEGRFSRKKNGCTLRHPILLSVSFLNECLSRNSSIYRPQVDQRHRAASLLTNAIICEITPAYIWILFFSGCSYRNDNSMRSWTPKQASWWQLYAIDSRWRLLLSVRKRLYQLYMVCGDHCL